MTRRVAAPHVVNIADLRRLSKRRLPRMVFDYLDGGAEAEITLRDNSKAFEEVTFRPRGAVSVPACDLKDDGDGAHAGSAVHPRADRQQSHVLPERRSTRRRVPREMRERRTCCRRCRAHRWRKSEPPRGDRRGIKCTCAAAERRRFACSSARRRRALPRSSSRSIPACQGCANAICATA